MTSELVHIFNIKNFHEKKKTIIVLGAPRGGTSLISGVLSILGIYMGDVRGGQQEDHLISKYSKDLSVSGKRKILIDNIINVIEDRNSNYDIWGWKLPKTVYFINEVMPHLVNPYFIVIYRNPYAIAQSASMRGNRIFDFQLLSVPINHYKIMHDFLSKCTAPILVTSFDMVLNREEQLINSIISFLNIRVNNNDIKKAIEFCNYDGGYKKTS